MNKKLIGMKRIFSNERYDLSYWLLLRIFINVLIIAFVLFVIFVLPFVILMFTADF